MITEAIFSLLCSAPLLLLDLIPTINITIPDGVIDWLLNTCNSIGYLLPVKALMPILGIMISINAFKISWALLLRVKSFIPTMGA